MGEQGIIESIWQYWAAGGWLMPILAVIAFFIFYFYLSLWQRLRDALASPKDCLENLERRLKDNQDEALINGWLEKLPGAIPRLTRQFIVRCRNGFTFKDSYSQCRQAELKDFQSGFIFLAALVAVAPLLGLMGTVVGMIETFDAVGLKSEGTESMVSMGLSKALITTQVGLILALPGSFGLAHVLRLYHRLKNQLDRTETYLSLYYKENK